jgi:site-specific DNA-methyltransferase (adenine-specific)
LNLYKTKNDQVIIINDNFLNNIDLLKKADLIATDPPYNINFKYNNYKDSMNEEEYIKMLSEFQNIPLAIIHYPEETMKYFIPALGVPNEVIVWCYNSNLPRQSRLINFYNVKVNFEKVKQAYKNPKDKRVLKLIESGSDGTRLYDWFSDIQLVKNTSDEKTFHPCPVPIKLMERIILLTTNENDLIIDPFCGSGTTAIACINTNRKFIGFEIDEFYFNKSKERLMELENSSFPLNIHG